MGRIKLREKLNPSGNVRYEVDTGERMGGRQRKTFRTRREAREFVVIVEKEDQRLGNIWNVMTPTERLDILSITHEMKALGLSLRQVWTRYRETLLTECPSVEIALDTFLRNQQKRQLRPKYLAEQERVLYRFCESRWESKVSDVRQPDIEAFLERFPNPHTFKTALAQGRGFLEFCRRQEWVIKNNAAFIQTPILDRKTPKILSIAEVSRLLSAAEQHDVELLPILCLSVFCGIRPEELLRLRSEDIMWRDRTETCGTVTIGTDIAKTRRRRIVDIPINVKDWYRLVPEFWDDWRAPANLRKRMLALREISKIEWSHDVLRHTAASFMVSLYQSAERAALQLGNSVPILLQHYRELVTEDDTKLFYALRPTGIPCRPAEDGGEPGAKAS
jgi:integrase